MPTIQELKRAVVLSEKIQELQRELDAVLGGSFSSSSGPATSISKPAKGTRKGKRTMSPEAREKIAAAQRRRWKLSKAEAKGGKAAPVTGKSAKKRKKSRMSPEGLAKIKAAQARRWAAYRKEKKAGE